ncbi:unnamed protein product [Pleuronectes platessa]|uniref:Uncharacterized protein n=1 Tax=Pleuronectes platessa TaxID=8262 RepID=A0A9N7VI83_PLEPL|nr:unnamed protein product [Pleuronectes platessa]
MRGEGEEREKRGRGEGEEREKRGRREGEGEERIERYSRSFWTRDNVEMKLCECSVPSGVSCVWSCSSRCDGLSPWMSSSVFLLELDASPHVLLLFVSSVSSLQEMDIVETGSGLFKLLQDLESHLSSSVMSEGVAVSPVVERVVHTDKKLLLPVFIPAALNSSSLFHSFVLESFLLAASTGSGMKVRNLAPFKRKLLLSPLTLEMILTRSHSEAFIIFPRQAALMHSDLQLPSCWQDCATAPIILSTEHTFPSQYQSLFNVRLLKAAGDKLWV